MLASLISRECARVSLRQLQSLLGSGHRRPQSTLLTSWSPCLVVALPIHEKVVGASEFSTIGSSVLARKSRTAATFAQRGRKHGGGRNQTKGNTNNNPTSPEREVRHNTKWILGLGEKAQNTGVGDSKWQALVQEKSFWKEAGQAINWWSKQGTSESVESSFRVLDALANLSTMVHDPKSSSPLLGTKMLNAVVQNWLVALARGEATSFAPQEMFRKLEEYRTNSQATSHTRRNLTPDLQTYQLLMEARCTSTPTGYNEFIVRHLMEPAVDMKPDLKTAAHILHGWSLRGQIVAVEEVKSVMSLLQDVDTKGEGSTTTLVGAPPVELVNKALFALASGNSTNRDPRGAEKMLSTLNFLNFVASRHEQKHQEESHNKLRPNSDTYNVVLNAFARIGKGAQAELILRNWVDSFSRDVYKKTAQPTPKSFTIVITGYGNSEGAGGAKKSEGVLRWQQKLNKEGSLQGCIPPETVTYNNVIRAWSWHRSDKGVDRCDELRREMVQHNLTPDLQTYGQSLKGIALSNLREKGKRAVQVWREMSMRGIQPNTYAKKYFNKCVALSDPWSRRTGWNRKQGLQSQRRDRLVRAHGDCYQGRPLHVTSQAKKE